MLHLPTCVGLGYGHLMVNAVRSFSWKYGINQFFSSWEKPTLHLSINDLRFIPTNLPTCLYWLILQPDDISFSVPALAIIWWYRNIYLSPIGFAIRLHLRGRLTLPGLSLDRNPWAFGERVSHPLYRYSRQHSHFHPLQKTSRFAFSAEWNAPLPLPT